MNDEKSSTVVGYAYDCESGYLDGPNGKRFEWAAGQHRTLPECRRFAEEDRERTVATGESCSYIYPIRAMKKTISELIRNASETVLRSMKKEQNEAIELAWGLIANGYGGDWSRATPEWRDAAERWRDRFVPDIAARARREAPEELVTVAMLPRSAGRRAETCARSSLNEVLPVKIKGCR